MKILLLEPIKNIEKAIFERLRLQGHQVSRFETFSAAISSIDSGYDGFIIEMSHNPEESLFLLRTIKKSYSFKPVLMLYMTTNLNCVNFKKAYAYGCNDLIKAPFSIDEFKVKFNHIFNVNKDIVYITENCTFDFKSRSIYVRNKALQLSEKENLLLKTLVSYKNNLVSHEMISAIVWNGEFISFDSIRTLIYRLKCKVPLLNIVTLVGSGYILRQ